MGNFNLQTHRLDKKDYGTTSLSVSFRNSSCVQDRDEEGTASLYYLETRAVFRIEKKREQLVYCILQQLELCLG